MKRVVITGMGIVSPVGTGIEYAWKNILDGVSGVRKIDTFDASDLTSQIAGLPVIGTEPGQYNPDAVVDAREQRKMDKSIVYGMVAADEAMRDAGLVEYDGDKTRMGVSIGAGIGGLNTIYDNCVELYANGPRHISPFFIPKVIINMTAGHVSIKYGLKGPNLSVVTACASAAHSIGEAVRLIQHGDADVMVAGGAEGAVGKIGVAGFCAMKALSTRNDEPTKASRPWDKDRDGFVMSEGAGILILEEYEHAKARGAKIYAEVVGYGATGDAYHITSPAPGGEGGARALTMALKNAGLNPEDVDYINAHGTSTSLNDKFETAAIKTAFGEYAYKLAMSSTKGCMGHSLGAAGGLETIVCIKTLQTGVIPPTINYETPDPECDLDCTPNTPRERKVDVALNTNLGFGGHNAVIIVKKI